MGYAVQADPDQLAADAAELARVANTLETLAGRLTAACLTAATAVGGGELAGALERGARTGGASVAEGAQVTRALGTSTGRAADDYRLLEQALAHRWDAASGDGGARS